MRFKLTSTQIKMLIDGKPLSTGVRKFYATEALRDKLRELPEGVDILLDGDTMELILV